MGVRWFVYDYGPDQFPPFPIGFIDYGSDDGFLNEFVLKNAPRPILDIPRKMKRKIESTIRAYDANPIRSKQTRKAIIDFMDRRDSARLGAIAVMGALRARRRAGGAAGTSDVSKIIARVVWSTRVFYK